MTLDRAAVDLRARFWEHGQLYVALSLVREPLNLCVLLLDPKQATSETDPDDVELGIIVDPELVTVVTGMQAAGHTISEADGMLNEATTGASYSRLPRSDIATSQIRVQSIPCQVLNNVELLLRGVMTEGSESADPNTQRKALQRTLTTATIRLARLSVLYRVHKAYGEGFELAIQVFALPNWRPPNCSAVANGSTDPDGGRYHDDTGAAPGTKSRGRLIQTPG
jgi:hypothetical protein